MFVVVVVVFVAGSLLARGTSLVSQSNERVTDLIRIILCTTGGGGGVDEPRGKVRGVLSPAAAAAFYTRHRTASARARRHGLLIN